MMRYVSRLLMQTLRRERMAEFRKFERNQWRPADDLMKESRDLLTTMLRHAVRSTPFYKNFCADAGLDPAIVSWDDLHRFPTVSKTLMTRRREDFLDPGAPDSSFVSNFTGGSTGTPFHFFSDRSALVIRKANDMRSRAWTGWRPGDKQANLWAHPRDHETSESLKERLRSTVIQRMRTLNAYDMDDAAITAFHGDLARFRPALLIGYASSLAFLARYLQRQGMPLAGPKGIISSAETLTDDHRAAIEGYFQCPVLNRYGSREFGVMAQQCEMRGGMHVFMDRIRLEILDREGQPCPPGERGEIVVTDLHNAAMPFIRYRTGDVARWAAAPCSCGRELPLLEAVEGRTSELLVGRNGKFYSCLGPRFFGADAPAAKQMQVIQESLDEILISIVPEDSWQMESADWFKKRTRELLGDVEVAVILVEKIPPAPSGKFPFTISKVAAFDRGEDG